jgi:hypothetical protein
MVFIGSKEDGYLRQESLANAITILFNVNCRNYNFFPTKTDTLGSGFE